MISFSKNFKVNKLNKGMTYVELIVVLSIFSIMTSIVLFNYNEFQAKVDIKVLANDIVLNIVEAQKVSFIWEIAYTNCQYNMGAFLWNLF